MVSEFETMVKEHLEGQGYRVLHRGWPDFIAVKGRRVRLIEAKTPNDTLNPYQVKVHDILRRKLRIPVEVVYELEDIDNPSVTMPEACHAICAFLPDSGEFSEAASERIIESLIMTVWREVQAETDYVYELVDTKGARVFDMVLDSVMWAVGYPWIEKKCVLGSFVELE